MKYIECNCCHLNDKETAIPIKRFDNYSMKDGYGWWVGYCPRCDKLIDFNFSHDCSKGNRRNYCYNCGQLVDFECDINN